MFKHFQWIPLWEQGAPGALGQADEDVPAFQWVPAQPEVSHRSAVILCPGGGYAYRAHHEEGSVALWLAGQGITVLVLRYRVAPYKYPWPLADAQRAIRLARHLASDLKFDPNLLGIMGFSAGGHLASAAATHFDDGDFSSKDPVQRLSSRPDFQVLIYPVISMTDKGHLGSRENLLGKPAEEDLVRYLSGENQVTAKTPPAFLAHSTADTVVPVLNADLYAEALQKAGVPHEYVRLDFGQHGSGLHRAWTLPCEAWLKKMGF